VTWVTAGELAEVMRWSERYVYKLAHLHRWRRVKEGRTVRYHWEDVVMTTTKGSDDA
jgi:excisionase family DNA binding protein